MASYCAEIMLVDDGHLTCRNVFNVLAIVMSPQNHSAGRLREVRSGPTQGTRNATKTVRDLRICKTKYLTLLHVNQITLRQPYDFASNSRVMTTELAKSLMV